MNCSRTHLLGTAIALALAAGSATAADRIDLHQQNVGQLRQQYQALTAGKGVATMVHRQHEQFLGLNADNTLLMKNAIADHGVRNYRYDQAWRGIPIFGQGIVVSEDGAGNVRTLFGTKVSGIERDIASTTPKLTKAEALAAGKRIALGNALSAMQTRNEKSDLVIFVDDAGKAHLAYAVTFFADSLAGNPTRPIIMIDAISGQVIKKWENLQHALVGTGPGGNTKTGQYEWGSGGIYGYMDVTQSGSTCTMNNTKVKAVNLNGGTTGTTAFSYTCPRNTYKTINGGYSPINDAFQFGGVITNMYPAYTGYNALSFQLVMRVHYKTNYENAFWDGSTMSFGDGASTFYPLVSADVAGHEVSHGFTEQHSNLTYSGQSGGINEAFSDMGGEATEYYWKGTNDFLVGSEIFKGSGALRYMCNPTQDGGSIDNAANYTSGLDVHYSSGVYNKAFCLLAKTAGWGVPKAFKVFARANANYWTASSTFNSAACGVETAAADLGYAKADVTAAFKAVGVACPTSGGGSTTTVNLPTVSTGYWSSTYTLAVTAGKTATISISGGTGDADLYVRAGSTPTTTSYTCRPYKTGNNETCTLTPTSNTTYYIRVYAYSTYSGVTLTYGTN
ncbi:M4 family metallopeptidase [Thermomonas hydrothermalis]|uniref:Neutral metalloproteinase n=1 Tax=Thermomonas hydrothermalis TaxID=213588 RepID=A0A1M5B218_9GAMM|nr:M4 family metallopeptidase [Thermomonas hydrothermalis]SHF36523.1 pseudolysin [Thermomonas hydrothermalis]